MITLSVIGVLYGAVVAIGQADMKRLIAYTSVSHFGLITLGIFAMTSQGQSGATLYMVNHGFATGALFLIAGFMIARRRLAADRRLRRRAEGRAGAGRALPDRRPRRAWRCRDCPRSSASSWCWSAPSPGTRSPPILATLGIILAAIYILWMYQRTMTGPVRDEVADMPDLKARELWAVGPLIALIIVLGVYPKPVLDIINPAVHQTLVQAHAPIRCRRTRPAREPCAIRPRRGLPAWHRNTGQQAAHKQGSPVTGIVRLRADIARRTSSTSRSPRCCWSLPPPWSAC